MTEPGRLKHARAKPCLKVVEQGLTSLLARRAYSNPTITSPMLSRETGKAVVVRALAVLACCPTANDLVALADGAVAGREGGGGGEGWKSMETTVAPHYGCCL